GAFALRGDRDTGDRDRVTEKEEPKEFRKELVEDKDKDVPEVVRRPDEEKGAQGLGASFTNGIKMKLVRIPAGAFKMGSPGGEPDRNTDEEQHDVEITRDFYLGVYEVTQREFKKVMGYNPSHFSADGTKRAGATYTSQPASGKDKVPGDTSDFPVENVSWEE